MNSTKVKGISISQPSHRCDGQLWASAPAIVPWTRARIIDESLYFFRKTDVKVDPNTGHQRSKYEKQADFILYRINIYKPAPAFILYSSDLEQGSQLEMEMSNLDEEGLDDVMRESIYRLLDELNTSEFKIDVLRRNIRWEIK